jgi:hypothetical protein
MNTSWSDWSERHIPTLLTIIAGLLVAIIIELALLISPGPPAACAQIPNSGLQRKELIDGIDRTNQKLDELKDILRTQVFKVRVVGTDTDKKTAPSPTPARPPATR